MCQIYCTVYPRGIAHAFVIELCGERSTPYSRRKDKPCLDYGEDSKPFGVRKNTARGDASTANGDFGEIIPNDIERETDIFLSLPFY